MNHGNPQKIKSFEDRRHLSQPLHLELSCKNSVNQQIRNLKNPTGKEADDADGIGLVAELDDRGVDEGRGDRVVVVGERSKEDGVANHFDDKEEDANQGNGHHNVSACLRCV